MRSWIKRVAAAVVLAVVTGLAATWWAVRQTHYVPEFYTRATQSLPASTIEASRHLEAGVVQLQNDAAKVGSWQATFSADEINAWLIEQLPKKLPQLFAKGASDPRIVIENNTVYVAVRYKDRRIDTVVSCQLEVELTEQPNMLAFNVKQLRAGALPLPLDKFMKGISKEAAKGEIDIRWDVTETGPVALVTIPSEHPTYAINPVIVESVLLVDGALILSGHTGPLAHDLYRPKGSVYQFVSYQPADKRSRKPARISARRDSSSRGRLR